MSNKLWILTKVFLKNGGDSFFTKKKKGKNFSKAFSVILIVGILIASIGIPFGLFIGEAYDTLISLNQEGSVLAFILSVVSMTIFIFGIFYVLTVFYFSKDIEFLLPLPLKPYEILGAKFITVVLYEYLTELTLLAPALIAYGIKSGAGVIYYVLSLIIFLTLPIVPLVVASVLNMIIMRFTNFGRHKDALKIIGGLIAMFFGIGVNIFIQRGASSAGSDEALIRSLMEGNNSLIMAVGKLFPTSNMAAWALVEGLNSKGIFNFLLFILITAAMLIIFIILAEGFYFAGVVGLSENFSRRKEVTGEELEKASYESSKLKSYTIKEFRLLFRTPAYLMNCVIMNFLWPIFIVLPMAFQEGALDKLKSLDIKMYTQDEKVLTIALAVILGISLFITSTNGITATAISREGQNFYLNKYLPIRYREQLWAKLISGIVLSEIGMLMVIVIVAIIARPPIYMILVTIVTTLLAVTFISLTGLIIDLNFPKLHWDNEQKAVKQNFNTVINMLIGLALGIASAFLLINFQFSFRVSVALIILVFGALDIILIYLVSTSGEKLYSKID